MIMINELFLALLDKRVSIIVVIVSVAVAVTAAVMVVMMVGMMTLMMAVTAWSVSRWRQIASGTTIHVVI
jgi:hypothetical protein